MSASASHRSVLRYLYNHNPFYVISAVLMLFAVRSAIPCYWRGLAC